MRCTSPGSSPVVPTRRARPSWATCWASGANPVSTQTFARRTAFRVRCLLLRLWCGHRGCRGGKRVHAKSQGAEHYTAVVDRTHEHVQHRVTLDRRCGVVRGDQKSPRTSSLEYPRTLPVIKRVTRKRVGTTLDVSRT